MDPQQTMQAKLIADAVKGDYAAFTQILERYKGLIYQLAYQMSGQKDDAMDITQEVFVKLFTQLHSYNNKYQFSSWLYRLTINASIDFHRKQKRHKISSLDAPQKHDENSSIDIPGKTEEPYVTSSKSELAHIFRNLAAELPPKQRAVFVLKDLEEKESSEVASILEISEATVRSHLHSARKKVRLALMERYKETLESFMS